MNTFAAAVVHSLDRALTFGTAPREELPIPAVFEGWTAWMANEATMAIPWGPRQSTRFHGWRSTSSEFFASLNPPPRLPPRPRDPALHRPRLGVEDLEIVSGSPLAA